MQTSYAPQQVASKRMPVFDDRSVRQHALNGGQQTSPHMCDGAPQHAPSLQTPLQQTAFSPAPHT
jgi:hypothetical protein